ncbi:hypothetical protein CIB95_06400 [Lottiidibacillus patelloidae]|uniref:Radical SAM protein n=1 Tax=Lottiidibacillus patelloidae TaxID=2670334 RepID=A0A263BW62_9BACI|nr:hypothetical protein [Lottiidibacillus patelloidae]OZM57983.1 hypothetical protein CIB95_06400 [Lottiidibacillus patelloidae]
MSYTFEYDNRLGITIPDLHKFWDQYSKEEQAEILFKWEKIRGTIPDRIKDLEIEINNKQEQLNVEENFEKSCQLNSDIAELASIINDLWLWFRANQRIDSGKTHA